MQFPAQLKRIRQAKGVTQKQVANALGVSKQTITAYEAGTREPDLMKLITIAEVLDTTPDDLLGRKKAPAQIEQELTPKLKQIIGLLPYTPESIQDAILAICAQTANQSQIEQAFQRGAAMVRARKALADSAETEEEQNG